MKVLIVDDDQFLRVFASSKIEKMGFEVSVASDGTEALEQMRSIKPDIVLLDLIMPNKDGFAVLEEAKADESISSIPIIIISNLEQKEDVDRTKSLGAKDFFDKTNNDYKSLKEKILALVEP